MDFNRISQLAASSEQSGTPPVETPSPETPGTPLSPDELELPSELEEP